MAAEAIDTKSITENAISAFNQSYPYLNTKGAFLYRIDDKSELRNDEMNKLINSFEDDLLFLGKIVEKLDSHIKSLRDLNLTLEEEQTKQSQEQLEKDKKNKKAELMQSLKIMQKETVDKTGKDIIDGFISVINDDLDVELSEDNETILKDINTNRAIIRADAILFKFSDNEESSGMWYELVKGEHRWFYNLCWMFGHFMKNTNTFWIAHNPKIDSESIFSHNNMYHRQDSTSKKAGKFGSGFAREVSCCYRNGYKLKLDKDKFMLHNEQPNFSPQNLPILTFDPVGTEAKEKQVFDDFSQAIKDYNLLYQKRIAEILEDLKSDDQFTFLKIDNKSTLTPTIPIILSYLEEHPPGKIDREKQKKGQNVGSIATHIKHPKQAIWDETVNQIRKIITAPTKNK